MLEAFLRSKITYTISRLIDIDLQIQQEPEPERYEFGYYTFDSLPTLEVSNVKITQDVSLETKIKILLIMIFGNYL